MLYPKSASTNILNNTLDDSGGAPFLQNHIILGYHLIFINGSGNNPTQSFKLLMLGAVCPFTHVIGNWVFLRKSYICKYYTKMLHMGNA